MTNQAKRWPRNTEQRFFETLNELLQNGYTLQQSLILMQDLLPKQRKALHQVQETLSRGETLANSLVGYVRPHILDELNLVSLHGCQLALLHLVGEREKQYQLQFKQLRAILCYPILLFVLLAVVGMYLGMYVLPQEKTIDAEMVGLGIIGFILLVIMGLLWFKKRSRIKKYQFLMRIPLVGKVIELVLQQALYLQLGYLLQSGVSLQMVMAYCDQHPSHWICQLIGRPVREAWEKGGTLEQGLNQVAYLSTEAKNLFMRGNATQQIGRDLVLLATYLNEQQKQRVQTLMACIQPVCFVVIGIFVIGLYMALLLPLYDQMIGMGELY